MSLKPLIYFGQKKALNFYLLVQFLKNMGKDKHFKPNSRMASFRHCFMKFSPENLAAQCVTKTHTRSCHSDFFYLIGPLSNEKLGILVKKSSKLGKRFLSYVIFVKSAILGTFENMHWWAFFSLEIATWDCENAPYEISWVKDMVQLVFVGS